MTTQEQSVPKYFSDFVQENARQHQELADRISGVEVALTARISGVETSLGNRIGGVETSLGARISGLETSLGARISGVETSLGARIGGLETSVGTRIGGVEGELRIIKAVSVAMLGATVATFAAVAVAVIKYVFSL